MAEILDIMSFEPTGSPTFTVDTTPGVLSVAMSMSSTGIFFGNGSSRLFQAGDNFIILSAGFVLPESFTMAKYPVANVEGAPILSLQLYGINSGVYSPIKNFGDGQGLQLPLENYEMPLGIFVPLSSTFNVTDSFLLEGKLYGSTADPRVSMIGVPSTLNTTVQHATVFLKVLHNFPLLP